MSSVTSDHQSQADEAVLFCSMGTEHGGRLKGIKQASLLHLNSPSPCHHLCCMLLFDAYQGLTTCPGQPADSSRHPCPQMLRLRLQRQLLAEHAASLARMALQQPECRACLLQRLNEHNKRSRDICRDITGVHGVLTSPARCPTTALGMHFNQRQGMHLDDHPHLPADGMTCIRINLLTCF